jgi:hypothetical protein
MSQRTATVTNRLIEPSVTTHKTGPMERCAEISKHITKIFVLHFDHHLLLARVKTYVGEGKGKMFLERGQWRIGDTDPLIPNLGTRWRWAVRFKVRALCPAVKEPHKTTKQEAGWASRSDLALHRREEFWPLRELNSYSLEDHQWVRYVYIKTYF